MDVTILWGGLNVTIPMFDPTERNQPEVDVTNLRSLNKVVIHKRLRIKPDCRQVVQIEELGVTNPRLDVTNLNCDVTNPKIDVTISGTA